MCIRDRSNVEQNIAVQQLLQDMIEEDSEIITIIAGAEAGDDTTAAIEQWLEAEYPEIEMDLHHGQQPVYPYLFSVE